MLFSINSLIIKELTHYYLFCHYTVFLGLNPIFRWLYNTIFICSKNKNTWKLTAMRNKFQTWIMNTSNLICLRLYSINSLTTTEWKHCFFRFAITVFHGLNPIFRWLYDTIFICSKNKNQAKNYYGTCEKKFKERYSNHTVSFRNKSKEKSTELSKCIWELKNSSINYDLNWSIAYKSHPCLNLIYV